MDEIRLCEVANETEAILVTNLLIEQGIEARSDATNATPAFGGLPFESGHAIFVPREAARKAREVLSHYPHFQDLRNVHEHDS